MTIWWCEVHESGRKIANEKSQCDSAALIVLEGLWPARCKMVEKQLLSDLLAEGAAVRLRKPCQHNLYDEHHWGRGYSIAGTCPGGEFIADNALLSECSDAALQEEWIRRTTKGRMQQTMQAIGDHFAAVDDDPYRHWGEDV